MTTTRRAVGWPQASAGECIYRILLETLSDQAVYLLDPSGHILDASPGGEAMTGFARGELVSRHASCFYKPEDNIAEALHAALELAADTGKHISEGWQQRKNAGNFLARTTIDAIRSPSGELIGFAYTMSDLSRPASTDSEERRDLFASIVKGAPAGLFLFDPDTLRFVEFNDLACQDLGYDRATFSTLTLCDLQTEMDPSDVRRNVDQVLQNGQGKFETKHRRASGQIRDVEVTQRALNIGSRRYVVGSWLDITDRKATESMLRSREQQLRSLVEHSPDGIVRYDRGLRRIFVNDAMEQFLKDDPTRFVGVVADEGSNIVELDKYREALMEAFVTGEQRAVECRYIRRDDGTYGWVDVRFTPEFGRHSTDDRRVSTVLAISRDITERVKHNELVARLAFTDALTGLPNRALFNDRLVQLHADSVRHGRIFAVMMIDIDNFKDVNDSLGHRAGDLLLEQVARRLEASVRKSDTLARIGGDEFAILLACSGSESVTRVARKLFNVLTSPFQILDKEVVVTISIGAAVHQIDSLELDDLTAFADAALYQAKREGRNSIRFYTKALTDAARERLAIGTALRSAISRSELELHYQAKISLTDGQLVGAEALLRWHHPELGLLMPDKFIQVAEETGLIVPIGEWVIESACRTARDWNASRQTPIRIAVNLSPRQFVSNDLAGCVERMLARTGTKGEWLEFELTESMLLSEDVETRKTLTRLRELGITIAIDDFGTGHSALAYFNRFELDVLKIDRAFIAEIESRPRKAELVKAFLSLAMALGLETVAEGVETAEQSAILARLGCVIIQGYLHGRPSARWDFEQSHPGLCKLG